ncbi:hypothetical protein [Cognatiluteimonas profundi]|uniref:hypothetical protein n=1 Tax=Cognatiluteimonas profundi TaxID=2594501 RepID=UPI00131CA65C|nr:hypothetical protein [Lysobacter profundi]
MGRPILTIALLAGTGLLGSVVSASPPPAVVGTALQAAPQSRAEGNQAVDDATAAALIGAISGQFAERNVAVKLDAVDVEPAGIVQREITGRGRLLIGKDAEWIPFHFTALYDTEQASVGHPDLTLGGAEPGQAVPVTSSLARALSSQVDQRLHSEFGSQPSQFAVDSIQSVPAGGRYVRIDAIGTADFGPDGNTSAGVHALYDPRTQQWLRLTYELGATANRAGSAPAVKAVASR